MNFKWFVPIYFLYFLFSPGNLNAEYQVSTVDFLSRYGLTVNGAGPLLVKVDISRNRILLVNTNTSSLTLINGRNHQVTNIPLKARVPQYLKSEAITIAANTGNIYILGNKCLHIVYPDSGQAQSLDTGEQYEMVGVVEKSGHAFLVGRNSSFLLKVNPSNRQISRIKWVEFTEPMINLNMTPPPPIRKVICDTTLNRVIAIDGYTNTLFLFHPDSKKPIQKRVLPTQGGKRWHLAGYNSNTHHLYLVIETEKRAAIEALKIDIVTEQNTVVALPGLTEPVGVTYSPTRDEVYISYDNHPSLHIVDFKAAGAKEKNGVLTEVKIPAYGNDAIALDETKHRLYVASWAYAEVDMIDLESRVLIKRFLNTGILPHMFNMAFNPHNNRLYFPVGATAVNGSFGAALDLLDPETEKIEKIHTGWAPVALVTTPDSNGCWVFNSEDEAALVKPDGSVSYVPLPCRFINQAIATPTGNIYIAYGPHQSYWPSVYIWGAKNGILAFSPTQRSFYDRRIPRMTQQMTLDQNGVLYGLQNNWGEEKQFLFTLPDEVRQPNLGQNLITFENKVTRETTQRILKYDEYKNWLYLLRSGESNSEPGILQIYDITTGKVLFTTPVGLTPTDIAISDQHIYIANFDANFLSAINKTDFSKQEIMTGSKPFKLLLNRGVLYCLNHGDNTLQTFQNGVERGTWPLPIPGRPANFCLLDKQLIICTHQSNTLVLLAFDTENKTFSTLHTAPYPYGETTVDTDNSSFFMRGQLADGIFQVNQMVLDRQHRLWISDYLAGKVFIIQPSGSGTAD